MIIPKNLEELKPLKQWVNYIRIWNPTKHGGAGGYDKPPINPFTLWDGKTTDATHWTTYTQAAGNIGKTARHRDTKHQDERGNAPLVLAAVEGAGLVLARGYCGVDLDGVIDENGNLAPFAANIVNALDTYTEVSPSGRGLHCLLYCGDLLEAGRNYGKQFLLDAAGRITGEKGKRCELEVYFYTNGGRYFTVTGNVFLDRPIARDKSKHFLRLYDFYTEKAKQYRAAKAPARSVGTLSTSRPADSDANRTMIESALQAIDPAELDFGEWAAIGSGLKQNGYSCETWENWSEDGGRNSKHVTNYTYTRWENLKDIDEPTRAILGIARRFGWNAADAFTKEQRTEYGRREHPDEKERTEYGRSLYTEEQRAEYGRSLYTEEQRREYGRKMNQLTPEEEKRFEEFAKALRERAKQKTQTPTAKGWD